VGSLHTSNKHKDTDKDTGCCVVDAVRAGLGHGSNPPAWAGKLLRSASVSKVFPAFSENRLVPLRGASTRAKLSFLAMHAGACNTSIQRMGLD